MASPLLLPGLAHEEHVYTPRMHIRTGYIHPHAAMILPSLILHQSNRACEVHRKMHDPVARLDIDSLLKGKGSHLV